MKIGKKSIDIKSRTYFIAEIGSNFDGDRQRAIDLIHLAKESGADSAKFQHYTAGTLVSNKGFTSLSANSTHQSKWKKSVYETYEDASLKKEWTPFLAETCEKVGLDFITSPYSFDLVDYVDEFVKAYKIGSGDITWHDIIKHMLTKKKPVLLATGASNEEEVSAIMNAIKDSHEQVILMQCNTNYSGDKDHFTYSQLNVLRNYRTLYPNVVLGLSDHTPGYVTTLGAVALGARVIEKHFTDDNSRNGPDHSFALEATTFSEMVEQTRDLEDALGSEFKKVEENEVQTRVVQRRAIRAVQDLVEGSVVKESDLEFLRPCPEDALPPYKKGSVIGKKIKRSVLAGETLLLSNLI